jgi:hypothetical protein
MILLGCAIATLPADRVRAAATPQAETGRAEMPVRMVVLFSSGVGYFEHGGTVQGNSSVELRFKSSQINDILKSLVLEDLDGGKIGTIAYPSQDPIEKTLKNFQVDITSNPSLAELLNQLRGAPVLVTVHAEQIEGTILGLEKRKKTLPGQNNQVIDEWMFNIMSGAAMRSVALDEVQKIELRDPDLQRDLQKALSALAEARNQDKKPVLISFQGEGNRKVRLRYVIETPVWKTSYRLILPQDKKGKSKLQGWALVENQTDTDWNDVQLSLVSGRPISFIEDLYKPIYVSRPVVEPELYKGLRPQNYEGGIAPAPAPAAAKKKAMAGGGRGGGAAGKPEAMFKSHMKAGPSDEEEEEEAAPFDATSSIVSAASAEKLGELFQYTLGKVSLPRLRSAMFPILTDDVAAERVSIFNAEVMPRNPLRGVVLRNSTDKYITQGPVTVFDGSTYAGDAQVGNLPPGQSRLLSYALDLEVQVDSTKNKQESAIQTAKIVKGILELSRKDTFSQEYAIQNNSDGERTLIIEHRFRKGWKLAGLQPLETTGTHYRLKQTVPKGKIETVTVVEENVRAQTITILPADIGPLESYSRSGEVPKSVRETLGKVIGFKQAIADTERLLEEKRNKLTEIDKEQNRIRSNMTTVNASSQYYSRLLEKLNAQETEIEAIQSEVRSLEKKLSDQKQELENFLANLTIA